MILVMWRGICWLEEVFVGRGCDEVQGWVLRMLSRSEELGAYASFCWWASTLERATAHSAWCTTHYSSSTATSNCEPSLSSYSGCWPQNIRVVVGHGKGSRVISSTAQRTHSSSWAGEWRKGSPAANTAQTNGLPFPTFQIPAPFPTN